MSYCSECAALERRVSELEATNKALLKQRAEMQERLRRMFYRLDAALQQEEVRRDG